MADSVNSLPPLQIRWASTSRRVKRRLWVSALWLRLRSFREGRARHQARPGLRGDTASRRCPGYRPWFCYPWSLPAAVRGRGSSPPHSPGLPKALRAPRARRSGRKGKNQVRHVGGAHVAKLRHGAHNPFMTGSQGCKRSCRFHTRWPSAAVCAPVSLSSPQSTHVGLRGTFHVNSSPEAR